MWEGCQSPLGRAGGAVFDRLGGGLRADDPRFDGLGRGLRSSDGLGERGREGRRLVRRHLHPLRGHLRREGRQRGHLRSLPRGFCIPLDLGLDQHLGVGNLLGVPGEADPALQARLVHVDPAATLRLELPDPETLHADQRAGGGFRQVNVLRVLVLDLHGDGQEHPLGLRHVLRGALDVAPAGVNVEVHVDLGAGVLLDLVHLGALEADQHADLRTRHLHVLGALVLGLRALEQLHDQLPGPLHSIGRTRDLHLAGVARLVSGVDLEGATLVADLYDGLSLFADDLPQQRFWHWHQLLHSGLQEDGNVLGRHLR
mmetsp:Transcript_94595/g.282515  ORF Transcript_94595/g.282515 Transcript_94595/m.282515 type:complete len:314 (+) Transcript_94595:32-973(+)